MPHLEYTADMRRKAGETNSATDLTDNLSDVETLGQGFDHVNVAPWSLDSSHVHDDGGAADELRQVYNGFDATLNINANNVWTGSASLDFTVDCESRVSGIFIWGEGSTTQGALGDVHDIGIFIDGAGAPTWWAAKGEGEVVGEGVGFAFEATAASHQVELKFRVNAGAVKAVDRASLIVFVVNR